MDTKIEEIVDYWSGNQDESGLSVDWAEAESLCWRCAQKRNLQRCHIIPRSLGGTEEPSNLVLLCAQCHSEAPNVNDPEFMCAYSGVLRTLIPGLSDRSFRFKPITDSGIIRPFFT